MKIYIIGDSISIQYGPYLKKYIDGKIKYSRKEGVEKALQNLDIPEGANGGDSSMVLKFLESKIAEDSFDSDFLMVNCGLHDIKKDPKTGKCQVSLDQYECNLSEIVKASYNSSLNLIWIRTTPCDEKIHNKEGMTFHRYSKDCKEYNNVADNVMKSNYVPIVDLYTFTNNLGTDLYCDHVHFHKHIQEQQASFIAGWLSAYLQSKEAKKRCIS